MLFTCQHWGSSCWGSLGRLLPSPILMSALVANDALLPY